MYDSGTNIFMVDYFKKGPFAHWPLRHALHLPKVIYVSKICQGGMNLMSRKWILSRIPYTYVHIYESSSYIYMVCFSGKGPVAHSAVGKVCIFRNWYTSQKSAKAVWIGCQKSEFCPKHLTDKFTCIYVAHIFIEWISQTKALVRTVPCGRLCTCRK